MHDLSLGQETLLAAGYGTVSDVTVQHPSIYIVLFLRLKHKIFFIFNQ